MQDPELLFEQIIGELTSPGQLFEIRDYKDSNGIPIDGVAFHPYHTSKDLVIIIIFAIIFSAIVFFAPEMGGYFLEHANFDPADSLKTPEHIAPVWYFTPFYAMLRAVPDKLMGVILMGTAIILPFFLPWLDRCKVKSIRYRGVIYKIALTLFVVSFIVLGYLGLQVATVTNTLLARIFSFIYISFFILMPIYTSFEKTKEVPRRVT